MIERKKEGKGGREKEEGRKEGRKKGRKEG